MMKLGALLMSALLANIADASVCDDIKTFGIDLNQFLASPVRYEIADTGFINHECIATHWRRRSANGYSYTYSFTDLGKTRKKEGQAQQRSGTNHLHLRNFGRDFHVVLINAEHSSSSSLVFCSRGDVWAEIWATNKNFFGSVEYRRRVADLAPFFSHDQFRPIDQGGNCKYDLNPSMH